MSKISVAKVIKYIMQSKRYYGLIKDWNYLYE